MRTWHSNINNFGYINGASILSLSLWLTFRSKAFHFARFQFFHQLTSSLFQSPTSKIRYVLSIIILILGKYKRDVHLIT